MSPFKQLGLANDADIPSIKRAYAKRLKQTRPEDDPQGFQRLHEAYQQALMAAEYRERYGIDEDEETDEADELVEVVENAQARDNDTQPLQGSSEDLAPSTGTPDSGPAPVAYDDFWNEPSSEDSPVEAADESANEAEAFSDETDAERIEQDGGEVFYLQPFLQEIHEVAERPDASLQVWLQRHPALYSLALKQAIVQPMLHALGEDFPPLRPKALEELLHYFQLDVVQPREQWIHWRVHYLREQSAEHWAMEAELWRLEHRGTPIERFLLAEFQRESPSWRRWLIALVPGLPGQAHALAKRLSAANQRGRIPETQVRFWSDFGDDGKLFLPRILSMFARCLILTGALFLLALTSGDTLFFPRVLAVISAPWLLTYLIKLSAHAMEHRTSGWVQRGWRMFKGMGQGLLEGMRSQSVWRWMLMIYLGVFLLRACAGLVG